MRPHALHLRDSGGLKLIPYRAGTIGPAVEGIIIRRNAGDGTHKDGIVAMHEGLDADCGLFLQASGVIAGPFAERPFLNEIVRMHESFERYFRMRWNWQPRPRAW